jgi:GMP synthase (glutamine-hydrolysing)
MTKMQAVPSFLTGERLDRLRHADAIVRKLTLESGFDNDVWQFPVVLIPFGTPGRPDSLVLRPIYSVDGMTASAVRMPDALLEQIVTELRSVSGVGGVFYDITNKPPATIEWE